MPYKLLSHCGECEEECIIGRPHEGRSRNTKQHMSAANGAMYFGKRLARTLGGCERMWHVSMCVWVCQCIVLPSPPLPSPPLTASLDAIDLYTPSRPYTIYTCTSNEKKLWLTALKDAIFAHLQQTGKLPAADPLTKDSSE